MISAHRPRPQLLSVEVKTVRLLTEDLFLLDLTGFPSDFDPVPGSFLHIKVTPGDHPLLRRPISIQSWFDGVVTLLIREVGVGTALMKRMAPGIRLDVLGPLGRGFSPVLRHEKVLMVGGGVGVAPLVMACLAGTTEGEVDFCYGARTAAEIQTEPRLKEKADRVRIHVATDDGSMGYRGFCTGLAGKILGEKKFTKIFACGPWPMMTQMAEYARKYDLPYEASLEVQMGCGLGACLSCVYETVDGRFVRSCVDGPVVDGHRVVWG